MRQSAKTLPEMGLVDDAMGGNSRALARLATHIENDDDIARQAIERLYPLTGTARTIGVTGPPGVGKSTFVNTLVGEIRRLDARCAVIAVDPSSPLSGGATLGDRIRMLGHHGDPGVFIRSVASRGRSGGLAPATADLIHLFDAVGFGYVIVETVGIGQEEIDVVAYVDSVILLQSPGFGDAVQSLKAGVLEVADLFVVNKADMPGAQATAREIKALLSLSGNRTGWNPPVVQVTSTDGQGFDEVLDALEAHAIWMRLSDTIEATRTQMAEFEVAGQIRAMLDRRAGYVVQLDSSKELIAGVANRRISPRRAAELLLQARLAAC
jgi:LAO/AO transport system kinase